MEIDNQRHNDSAIARAYIRNLADKFEDPEEILLFLNACDKAQAALIYWLFQEYRYVQIQLTQIREVKAERKSRIEIETAWNEYCQASDKFHLAKEGLKKIICKLNVNP
jgi:hypothetical protein